MTNAKVHESKDLQIIWTKQIHCWQVKWIVNILLFGIDGRPHRPLGQIRPLRIVSSCCEAQRMGAVVIEIWYTEMKRMHHRFLLDVVVDILYCSCKDINVALGKQFEA